MYEQYWQLQSRAFENSADARFYYPSEVHQGALLKLRYAVENRRGAALLAGSAGAGKTLLVNLLRRQLPQNVGPLVHLVFPQMTVREMLVYLVEQLGAPQEPAATHTADESIRRLERFFAGNSAAGRHAVVVIDEAQLLAETGALETMRLLLNFEAADGPALTLLLVGQPGLLPALERMPALEQRLGVKCLLRPFSEDETASYVTHRMSAAGATFEIFTTEALTALHELTDGSPRRINRLCDLALLVGFAEEQASIGAGQIESVSKELVTVAPE
jgi:general secretion pathway protein A